MDSEPMENKPTPYTAPCKICGQLVTQEWDMTPFEAHPDATAQERERIELPKRTMLNWFQKHACHDACLGRKMAEEREQGERQRIAERFQQWTQRVCPKLFQNTDEDLLPHPAAHEKVMEWSFNPKGLILFGKTGMGKTRSMFELLKREFMDGRSVVVVNHLEFERRFLRTNGEKEFDRWVHSMKTAEILFFDDLGKVKFTTASGEGKQSEVLLFDVFEARIMREFPTMFTTENTTVDLVSVMSTERGPGFARRLKEFCEPIKFF